MSVAVNDAFSVYGNVHTQFYNPKLYVAASKRKLSEEERITVNMGGTLAVTAAPGGIAGTGVTAFEQSGDKPGPAPEMYGDYEKSHEEITGVIAILALRQADLANMNTAARAATFTV